MKAGPWDWCRNAEATVLFLRAIERLAYGLL